MLYFVVGFFIGSILAYAAIHKSIIGKLRHVSDEDGTYFFMELFESNIHKIVNKKYVVLKCESDAGSQK